MIDRFGKEVDFSELFMEETLSAEDRKELDDSMYGIVYTDENGNKVRKYPLNDEKHVLQAVRFFNKAEEKYKPELARKIIKRAKELDMDYSGWDVLKPYLDKPVKESYMVGEDFSYCDDSYNKPDNYYIESDLQPAIRESLELIKSSITSKYFPDEFADYSSSMYFREELKNFIRHATVVVQSKNGPMPEGLHHLWILAKAAVDYDEYKKYMDKHEESLRLAESHVKLCERAINEYDSSNNKGQKNINSLKTDLDQAIRYKEYVMRDTNWGYHKSRVIKSISKILSYGYVKESFEETFGSVIQEAFDAITGEKIPIDHAYTMEEMAKRSLSLDEAKAIEKDGLIPIKPPKTDEVYFGSPTNHMPEIDLDRPLFVSPYKGIASIFIWRDWGLQDRIPRGSYNHNYEEWINFDEKKMKNPLKEVHVYVEGAPFLEPFTIEQEGYLHCIKTKDYEDNFFRKPWMTKDLEYLIAKTDNIKVEFTRSIKCKVKYYIKGRPSPKGKQYGPSKNGIIQYIHRIAESIHVKYKADQKDPTGNQNCLLCAWCAEASIRGGEYLPRPVYSPRDPALEIVPSDIIGGATKINPGSFHDMLKHLKDVEQPFARWYCHVKWEHGTGGHEFLIIKSGEDTFEVMDPQQGIVRPLNADNEYMKNVDWEGTYICRIDDKPFKYMKLDQINDPKKTLPWDPKKDIPYMLNMEYVLRKKLRKTETNLFTSELKKALGQTTIQESASDPMTIIPKDLQDWLKKGDYSSLEKDDSYYYVEGHPVEEFWRDPEFTRSAFYLDDKNDPSYNSIVFSDDNGNGLIYDPTDGWYYYLYHDWTEDDTGFLHRERLSSKSWTQIIDPTHSKIVRDSDEKRSKISKELTHLKGNPIYDDIEYGATNSHFGKGFFKSDCSAMEKRWNSIGHEWCNAVEDFADKYKFSELSEAVDTFANKTMSLFIPTIGSHEYDIESYKEGAKNVIKAFQDVENSLKESHIQESAIKTINERTDINGKSNR